MGQVISVNVVQRECDEQRGYGVDGGLFFGFIGNLKKCNSDASCYNIATKLLKYLEEKQ